MTRTHAKFTVLVGDKDSAVIRGSLNLNRNRQCEQIDIDTDHGMIAFFLGVADELCRPENGGFAANPADIERAFEMAFAANGANDTKQWWE